MLQKSVTLLSLVVLIAFAACEPPVGVIQLPPTPPSLEDEAKSVPWEKLSGRIAYIRNVDYYGYAAQSLVFIEAAEMKLRERKRLTARVTQATVSSDGRSVAYVRPVNPANYNYQLGIFKADTGGASETTVYYDQIFSGAGPAWSKDGRVAFWASGFSSGGTIEYKGLVYIDNEIFYQVRSCANTRPAWAPDGSFIIIVIDFGSNYQYRPVLLKVPVPFTSAPALLTGNYDENFSDPSVSSDGQKVVFVRRSYADTTSGIWSINVDGTNLKRITNDIRDRYPCFSPDGSKIAFERATDYWTDASGSIYVVNADGTDLALVTANGGSWPTWIP